MCLIVVLFSKVFLLKNNNILASSNIYDNSASSIVMDTKNNEVLYQNNIHKRMLPASTTKILTCITAIENLDLERNVYITYDYIKEAEGSSVYLEVGDVINIKDLLYGLMLCSGNDAAEVIAYSYSGIKNDFIYLMNETAKKIGMTNSTFENPHGLDSKSKNYTTTYDMGLLMSYALKNDIFIDIIGTKSYNPLITSGKKMFFKNKHKLIQNLDYVSGGKTGFTKNARRTLVTSFKKGNFEIVVVTFNCNNDFLLHSELGNYYLNNYE